MCRYREVLAARRRERERERRRWDEKRQGQEWKIWARNKNKQFHGAWFPAGLWIVFHSVEGLSGQPLSALWLGFHSTHLIQPASILNLMEFRPRINSIHVQWGHNVWWQEPYAGSWETLVLVFLMCPWAGIKALAFYKMGVVFPTLNIFMAALEMKIGRKGLIKAHQLFHMSADEML